MTLQLNLCANPEVDRLLMEHNNRPIKALYEALLDKAITGIELPMAIITDLRCGIERRAERADVSRYLVGATPLLLAFDLGRLDVAKALLAAGADPNAQASDGDNPLMVAVFEGNLEAIECLISYGADVNAIDNEGKASLHYAANLDVDVAKALLAAGADPNAQASDGDNPLMAAVREGNLEAIECLISYGADVNAIDNEGKASLHYAANWGYAGVIELLERSGPNLEACDNKGWTPLHDAATHGSVGAMNIKALSNLGANQAAVDNEGWTPLHCAAASEYAGLAVDAIEAFRRNVMAFEANLITVDNNGHTPLQVYECRSRVSSDNANDSKIRALLTPK